MAGAISTAVVASSSARADTPPSSWDLARDPAEADRWALHVRVELLLNLPDPGDVLEVESRREDERKAAMAQALLENADAAHSPDARLRFDLGAVYGRLATLSGRDDFEQKAIDVLVPALELAPDNPAADGALDTLAIAYSKLDRPDDELDAWRRYLGRVTTARGRVRPLMNMGEVEMRLGRLDDALATFREGLHLCETLPNSGVNEIYALTLWDLALALDRSGDPGAALSTAAKARTWTWNVPVMRGLSQAYETLTGWDAIRDESNVFFSPEWEREWYVALGFASAAATATDPRDAAPMWSKAEQHWASYVKRATAGRAAAGPSATAGPPAPSATPGSPATAGRPQEDRWLSIARARLSHAHAARVELEGRASSLPARGATSRGNWPDD